MQHQLYVRQPSNDKPITSQGSKYHVIFGNVKSTLIFSIFLKFYLCIISNAVLTTYVSSKFTIY